MKKILSLITVILVTAGALIYALRDVSFSELASLMSAGHYWVLVPTLVLLFLFYWIKAMRWALILKPVGHFTSSDVAPAMVIGFAGNNLLPAHLGELVRIVIFSRQFSKPVSSIATTLLVERVFDLAAILFLYAVGMATIGTPPESLEVGAWLITVMMIGFFVTISIILYRPGLVLGLGEWAGKLLPEKLAKRLRDMLVNIITAFSSLRSPRLVFAMLSLSILKWSFMAVMITLSLVAYETQVSIGIILVLMAVMSLAAAVPNAPGYVGAMQAAYVFALRPFGISEEVAIAASVLFLACQWLPVTLAGMLYFIRGGFHVAEVRREVAEAEE